MPQTDTKERILDAAERLFAQEGFHCTSLRTITGAAQVNLAAVNYHFGSKEALLKAVFARRLTPLNRARNRCLAAVRQQARAAGAPLKAAEVLRAFVEPTLTFRDSTSGARHFATLVGRSLTGADEAVRNIFLNLMGPTFALFFDALCSALPGVPKNLVFWRMRFALGALAQTMCQVVAAENLPAGVNLDGDAATMIGMLMPFIAAGMEAP